jgi:hypothetical protein
MYIEVVACSLWNKNKIFEQLIPLAEKCKNLLAERLCNAWSLWNKINKVQKLLQFELGLKIYSLKHDSIIMLSLKWIL